jgi:hypothetical protein
MKKHKTIRVAKDDLLALFLENQELTAQVELLKEEIRRLMMNLEPQDSDEEVLGTEDMVVEEIPSLPTPPPMPSFKNNIDVSVSGFCLKCFKKIEGTLSQCSAEDCSVEQLKNTNENDSSNQ